MATATQTDIELAISEINFERSAKTTLAIGGIVVALLLVLFAAYASYRHLPISAEPANAIHHIPEPYQ